MRSQNAIDLFLDCLKAANKPDADRADLNEERDPRRALFGELFRLWFLEHGNAYFFVFRKNASETNIQFCELMHLIRRNQTTQPHFASHREYREALSQVIGDCFPDVRPEQIETGTKKLIGAYSSLIEHTIVLDAFYGSAAVFLPPSHQIDLKEIVGLSGYIHSAGKLVGIRDMQKASIAHFSHRYATFIEKCKRQNEALPKHARLFSTESFFFDPFEKSNKESTDKHRARHQFYLERRTSGLNELMFSANKCFLGNANIRDGLTGVFNAHAHNLEIIDSAGPNIAMEPGDNALWVLCDARLHADFQKSRNERFYVIYQLLYRNSNQYSVFDEAMPAWKANETIPHSLISAAINVAIPSTEKGRQLRMVDPFSGSGTTLLQALKYRSIDVHASDMSPLSNMLFRDNLEVGSLYAPEIRTLSANLTAIAKIESRSFKARIASAHAVLDHEQESKTEDDWKQMLAGAEKLEERILLHLVRKSHKAGRLIEETIATLINRELPALEVRLDKLASIAPDSEESVTNFASTNLCSHVGDGYEHVSISRAWLKDVLRNSAVNVRVEKLDPDTDLGRFDLMITDPPYDFNVENESSYMLLKTLATKIPESVKSDGSVIIFLPSRSYTGKRVSPSVGPHIFIGNLLFATGQCSMSHLYTEVSRVPSPEAAFRGPFYWRAPRTLDRTILLFRFTHGRTDSLRPLPEMELRPEAAADTVVVPQRPSTRPELAPEKAKVRRK